MPTAENAKLQYEAGQQAAAMAALVDSGDNTLFESPAAQWSGRAGYTPVVRPDGLVTGGAVTPEDSAANDQVDVAAATGYVAGALQNVSAAPDTAITRAVGAFSKVNSITITNGGAIAVVAGSDGTDTNFSEVRAADGGPPLIPVTSIEIAQVRTVGSTPAAITADEIFDVLGVHLEKYDYPLWTVNYEDGSITMDSALPDIHTGVLPKNVYASYNSPIFADVPEAENFVPPENSHSVNSVQIYGKTKGSTSKTLGQGSFTAYLQDGVTDGLVLLKDEKLWFKFYPDRYKAPHILAQGNLGIARTFPAGDSIGAGCTISSEAEALEQST